MAEQEKKRLYGGSYDDAISDTYQQIQNRPAFSYDVDGDALYQQYKDRYTQNAKMAMKDTMGQAAALTGGYGNSYAQGGGQQRYDETMRGLTDMIPQLEGRAYERWQAEGNALQNRLGMLHNMGAAEQSTKQQTYSQIANLISTTGYQPTEQDLTNSGMTAEQANAMLQWWITNNPDAAYQNGQLSPEDYYKLTGRYPAGYNAAGGGGGGGWSYTGSGGGGGGATQAQRPDIDQMAASLGQSRDPDADLDYILKNYGDVLSAADMRTIADAYEHATKTGKYAKNP